MDTTCATVSCRLQSLEGLLGLLILRTTHAMKLTDDGERCYRHARQVVTFCWRWRMTCVLPDDRPVGVLRGGRPTASQRAPLAPLEKDGQRHPQLSVSDVKR